MKIGFACKFSELDAKGKVQTVPELNFKATTVAWLNRQPIDVAVERLWSITHHNIAALHNVVTHLGTVNENLRMFRLGSDILPVYTHSDWKWFWQRTDVRAYLERTLAPIGDMARANNIRLSFHPGQFCCIVSDREDVVTRSLEELEYHTDVIRWLGYGQRKLDFKMNIHLSGKLGADGFNAAWNRLSPEARNTLTLENDEYQKGLDDLLPLGNRAGIVLDIHHHLIHSEEYIAANDDRIKRVIDSWQGVRPVIHYSQSRAEYIEPFANRMPTMEEMLSVAKKGKLRAHSDFYDNRFVNEWALTHLSWADIMTESKCKNLSAQQLFSQAQTLNIL